MTTRHKTQLAETLKTDRPVPPDKPNILKTLLTVQSTLGHVPANVIPQIAQVSCVGFQLADGRLIGPRDMFDDPSYDEARRDANRVADVMRMHGPFEPHRLPLDEMEYTTMPQIMKKLEGRWTKF